MHVSVSCPRNIHVCICVVALVKKQHAVPSSLVDEQWRVYNVSNSAAAAIADDSVRASTGTPKNRKSGGAARHKQCAV
jgi:hypothetical protein